MARRRVDPCLRNSRKGSKILSSFIGTGLKLATNSSGKRQTSSNNGCMVVVFFVILMTSILFS